MKPRHWTLLALALVVLAAGLLVTSRIASAAEEPGPPLPAPDVPGEKKEPEPAPKEKAPTEKKAGEAGKAAEGEAGAAATRRTKKTVLETINAGGVIGYIIIGLSFVALSLIIEHAVSIRRDKLCPEELTQELEDYFNQEQYEEALELCNVERNVLTDVVRAGLSRIDSGYERMQEAMQEAGEEASVGLQQKISYLSLIGNIAPMLGLLGTVSGMVGAFGQIAVMTTVKPAELAGNINEALVTTLLGLSVAIPVMCAYQFFSNRVTRMVLEASTIISDMMERFKPAK